MLNELVNEVRVELNTLGVDGVITATKGDDACPRNRETVGLDTVRRQQRNILLPQLV